MSNKSLTCEPRLETPKLAGIEPSSLLRRLIALVVVFAAFGSKEVAAIAEAQENAKGPDLKIALTAEEQRKINLAVGKGVSFLKASLNAFQAGAAHPIGRAALAGWTLLECDVPAKDPAVAKAAALTRASAPQLNDTYSLALAILFLDKLGNPQDEKLIRKFAARLIVGQNSRGGWTYNCPILTPADEQLLLTALKDLPPLKTTLSRPITLASPLEKSPSLELQKGIQDPKSSPPANPLPNKKLELQTPRLKESSPSSSSSASSKEQDGRNEKVAKEFNLKSLPRTLQNVPALRVVPAKEPKAQEKKKGVNDNSKKGVVDNSKNGVDDNSNTQFAILGLWAARKHGVPMERTLVLVERRFRSAQNGDGSWGYKLPGHTLADSMTCAGLLGIALAMGADLQLQGQPAGQALADPTVKNGLAYLSMSIGKVAPPIPLKGKISGRLVGADARGDLYYLWSVERVAVAYGLQTIGQKDWFRWGGTLILVSQQVDGSWRERYAGIPDTSFALLFLVRANPVRDLPRLTQP